MKSFLSSLIKLNVVALVFCVLLINKAEATKYATKTPTRTPTPICSNTPTKSAPTKTPTATPTRTVTLAAPTKTPKPTQTAVPTSTPTKIISTPTQSPTPSPTPSATPTKEQIFDCMGVLFGAAVVDPCGVCGGDGSTCKDCKGVVNGKAKLDLCGVCDGDGKSCLGCDGAPNSGKVLDACGVCGGDNSSCLDCSGVPNGGKKIDDCGVCGGDNKTCLDCKGIPNGNSRQDICGVCGGGITNLALCPNFQACPNGVIDACGVCGGSNSCLDCAGIPNGGTKVDCCGVCGGDGNSCPDKCKIFKLRREKRTITKATTRLAADVNFYGGRAAQCSNRRGVLEIRKEISLAKKLEIVSLKLIKNYIKDTIKVCNTIYCQKSDLKSIIKTLNRNIKVLANLSRKQQYRVRDLCKLPANNSSNERSADIFSNKGNRSTNRIPAEKCD
jgi:hypothetical protein